MLIHGDCLEVLPTLDAESIDAIVTDPPYGLEFMGKAWDKLDGGLPQENVWKGRRGNGGSSIGTDDTKPSSRHHVSYGGKNPQFKRCSTCGKRQFSGSPCQCPEPTWEIETAQAAPSSAIRMQRWHEQWARECYRVAKPGAYLLAFGGTRTVHRLASAIEDAGWEIRDTLVWAYASGFPKSLNLDGDRQGWGTALKPAWEPIVMARKPLRGTVAGNVQAYGTGALNIDGCRIGTDEITVNGYRAETGKTWSGSGMLAANVERDPTTHLGRWPANVILTDPIFDGDTPGVVGGGDAAGGTNISTRRSHVPGAVFGGTEEYAETGYGDTGTYSRFFLIPKAARSDREPVLGGLAMQDGVGVRYTTMAGDGRVNPEVKSVQRANVHPTVKPTDLMRHLVRLVTPPGGTVLDPFLGSGTTALAAEMEGFGWVGIEREAEYVAIAEARLNGTQRGLGLVG